jgi:hypothetical protein
LIKGSSRLIELVFSNNATLEIEYVNQIPAASFDEGKIYSKVRRSIR